jgi:hypothetical protein
MTNREDRNSLPQFNSGTLITGAVLTGAGMMLVLAGLAVGSSHLFSATRRWVRDMDVPPSELARQKWAQARAAAAAGGAAWQNQSPVRSAGR